MKKLLVSLAVVCMVSLLAVCAFAAPVNDSFISGHVINEDGTVTFTYSLPAGQAWTEMRIVTTAPNMATDGTDQFWDFYVGEEILARIDNAQCVDQRVVGAEGSAVNSVFNFVDGQTYYVISFCCDGGTWSYSTTPYEFTYTAPNQDGDQDTADLSVIAYAVAAITGCGALVIARKK